MATKNNQNESTPVSTESSWGPKLFWITLLLVLVFFWWLLIYSHGVEIHHG